MVMVKPALPYLDVIRARQGRHAPARRRVQRQRRVRDGQGRRRRRLPRRARRRARGADPHPPRRRRHRHHLPRQGRRPMASVTPKLRSRKDGAAIPLDDLDKRLLNLMQGRFPIEPRPYAAVARGARGRPRSGCWRASASCSTSASSARSRRSSTPARSATARCSSPPRSTPSTRGAPAQDHQRAPRRQPQLPAQPRLQHVVHDRRRGGLRARASTARSTCCRSSPAPSRSASCRRSSCSRSAWTSRWRAAPRRWPSPPWPRSPIELEQAALRRARHRGHPRHAGRPAGRRRALRGGGGASSA